MNTQTEEVRSQIDEKWVGKIRERRIIHGRELLVGEPFELDDCWVCRYWFAGALEAHGESAQQALDAMEAGVTAWVSRMER